MVGFSTKIIHGHEYYDEERGVFKVPIYQVAIYEQPDRRTGKTRVTDRGFDLKYSREENITTRALEKILTKIEEGKDALAFNSGMAAISAIYLSSLKSGDKILISKECYGTSQQLAFDLSKFGIRCELANPKTEDFLEKINEDTSLVFVETITNPTLKIVDIKEIAKRCSEVNAILVVDNTFATPVIYNPIKDGANIVVHSTTKYISGHNDSIGGIVVAKEKREIEKMWEWRRKLGTILSPFESFLTIRGISTLKVRFEAQSRTALSLAEFLKDNPKVEEVYYPGLADSPYKEVADKLFKVKLYGGVLSFKVKGGENEAIKILKSVKIIRPAPSLGGVESLLTYPAWSASKTLPEDIRKELGITENLLRLSVGLEDEEDLKEDLSQALNKI